MDINWERSLPYYDLTQTELLTVFPRFKNTKLLALERITIGCRNTNYLLTTIKSKYLVRICSVKSALISNEIAFNHNLTKIINCPQLLDYCFKDKKYFMLYQFIAGTNLSHYLINNELSRMNIIHIAEMLAKTHSFQPPEDVKLEKLDLPPFESWYEYFLSHQVAAKLLGNRRIREIKKFVRNNPLLLTQIVNYSSFIHSDFRPANMIITSKQEIYIVDWEYCGLGHSLADIGQFFRYRACFNSWHKELFAKTYNQFSLKKLPNNWYLLARLRDLINPLQMLGNVEKKLHMQADLLNVVDNILEELYAKRGTT